MSSWKLVEAVAEPEPTTTEVSGRNDEGGTVNTVNHYRSDDGIRRGRGGRGYGKPQRSKADRSYYAYLATQQIDAIFNPDSLCMDTFIRSYMDIEGFVPISLVCAYQNVAWFGSSYYDIVSKLKEVAPRSRYFEIDPINETIRLKESWEMFLMPNGFGGRGLPKYVKQSYNQNAGYVNPYSKQSENTDVAPTSTDETLGATPVPSTAEST